MPGLWYAYHILQIAILQARWFAAEDHQTTIRHKPPSFKSATRPLTMTSIFSGLFTSNEQEEWFEIDKRVMKFERRYDRPNWPNWGAPEALYRH